jgi:hypothetical protein
MIPLHLTPTFQKLAHSKAIETMGLTIRVAAGVALTFAAGLEGSDSPDKKYLRDPFTWNTSTSDIANGVEGGCWGVHDNALIIAGGETRDSAGEIVLSGAIAVRLPGGSGSFSKLVEGAALQPFAHSASAGTEAGVICIGGITETGVSREAFKLWYNAGIGSVVRDELPPLPVARAYSGAVAHDSVLYVAGGSESRTGDAAKNSIWALPLDEDGSESVGWQEYPPWPGVGRRSPHVSVQFDGYGDSLILIGGRTPDGELAREVYAFNLKNQAWRQLRDLPVERGVSSVVNVGVAHVFALPVTEPGAPLSFAAYHTITDTWAYGEPLPVEGRPRMVLKDDASLLVVTEDAVGRILVSKGSPPAVGKPMHTLDYVIILCYLAVLIFLGYHFSRRENTTDDFLGAANAFPDGWRGSVSSVRGGVRSPSCRFRRKLSRRTGPTTSTSLATCSRRSSLSVTS